MDKYSVLKKYFGYTSFRGNQEEIIDSLISRINTIAILKTGGGKSICFQIPAIMALGVTIVITPLISLMYDQVCELKQHNIGAIYINSNINNCDLEKIYKDIFSGKIKIIYISPERLSNKEFLNNIKKVKISYLIVDEAHTILWHMDFRESFLNIKNFIRELGYDICLGLFSATANQFTLSEIKRVVGIYNFKMISSSFDRPELFYRLIRNENKLLFIEDYLSKNNKCGIIYCQTRREVMMIYEKFNNKYKCSYYHGGLEKEIKEKNQDYFLKENDVIMISTISFGMGINKPNIRFIINYNIPDSIEALSQMIGRCSRDGKYGECIILFNDIDKRVLNFFIREIDTTNKSIIECNRIKKYKYSSLNSLIKILDSNKCLHQNICMYFGEKIKPCITMCSKCKSINDK